MFDRDTLDTVKLANIVFNNHPQHDQCDFRDLTDISYRGIINMLKIIVFLICSFMIGTCYYAFTDECNKEYNTCNWKPLSIMVTTFIGFLIITTIAIITLVIGCCCACCIAIYNDPE